MDLQKFLFNFGLTETEAVLYLSLLKKAHMSVSELAKDAVLKRPAIYHALETLERKGLVLTIGAGKVLRYRAEPPEQLKAILNRRALELTQLEKKIDKAIPLFPTANEAVKGEARVEFFRGKEGIRNLAERSLQNEGKQLFGIVPSFVMFLEAFTREFAAYYTEEKRKRGIQTQSVWAEPLKDEKEFEKQGSDHAAFLREVRYAPKDIAGKYRSIILIWDDNVAIINATAELFGVFITSQEYAETMKALWVVLWNASRPSYLEGEPHSAHHPVAEND